MVWGLNSVGSLAHASALVTRASLRFLGLRRAETVPRIGTRYEQLPTIAADGALHRQELPAASLTVAPSATGLGQPPAATDRQIGSPSTRGDSAMTWARKQRWMLQSNAHHPGRRNHVVPTSQPRPTQYWARLPSRMACRTAQRNTNTLSGTSTTANKNILKKAGHTCPQSLPSSNE